jgi:hypothetical protein
MEEQPKCTTCRFLGKDKIYNRELHVCRRKSPAFVDGYEDAAMWPSVNVAMDWCGEHEEAG